MRRTLYLGLTNNAVPRSHGPTLRRAGELMLRSALERALGRALPRALAGSLDALSVSAIVDILSKGDAAGVAATASIPTSTPAGALITPALPLPTTAIPAASGATASFPSPDLQIEPRASALVPAGSQADATVAQYLQISQPSPSVPPPHPQGITQEVSHRTGAAPPPATADASVPPHPDLRVAAFHAAVTRLAPYAVRVLRPAAPTPSGVRSAAPPVFCFAPFACTADGFTSIAAGLPARCPVYGLENPVVRGCAVPFTTLIEMALFFAAVVRDLYDHLGHTAHTPAPPATNGPPACAPGLRRCMLVGLSYSAFIAFVVSRLLQGVGWDLEVRILMIRLVFVRV